MLLILVILLCLPNLSPTASFCLLLESFQNGRVSWGKTMWTVLMRKNWKKKNSLNSPSWWLGNLAFLLGMVIWAFLRCCGTQTWVSWHVQAHTGVKKKTGCKRRIGMVMRVFIQKIDMCQGFNQSKSTELRGKGEKPQRLTLYSSSIWHLAHFTTQHYNQHTLRSWWYWLVRPRVWMTGVGKSLKEMKIPSRWCQETLDRPWVSVVALKTIN